MQSEELNSVLENIDKIKHIKNTEEFVKQLKSLEKSYIKYISNDNALTKKDFLEYMEGLSVDEKKNSSGSMMKK